MRKRKHLILKQRVTSDNEKSFLSNQDRDVGVQDRC